MSEENKGLKPANPNRSSNPATKRGLQSFFKGVQRESKLVHWPAPRETTRLTGTVVGVCVLATVLLWLLSLGIYEALKMLGVHN